MLSEARKQVIRALSRTDVLKDISVEELLETPPRPELGDLALPCFELARKLRKPAPSIAQEIKETIKILPPLLARVEAKAGYVNFFFDWNRIASVVLRRIERLRVEIGKGRKVMVEYVSANPIHPLHVGQLRNALLGDSLVRLLEFVGYEVLKHFYVNDLGLQAAELVYAFNLLRRKRPKEKIDHWFGKLYAIVDRYLARDKEVLGELEGKWPKAYQELIGVLEKQANPREEVQALMQRCEAGDAQAIGMFREVAELCLKGFEETLKELGISFDSFDFESKFVLDSSVKKLVEELRQRGHLKKTEEGTWLLDLSTFGKPSLVLVRSDGTTLYTTRDIAYHIWKFEQGIERTINVIGAEQALAQAQLRHALKLLGMEKQSKSTIHLSYAHVRFPGVRFSGRRGRYLTIDELLRRAYEKALREVEKRNPGLSEAQKQRIARIVGRGAIKYAILKVDPNKEITFDLEKALSFEGDTGPYLQYAYTRCCGILRKAGEWKPSFEPTKLSPRERELIRLLAQLPEIIGSAARELRPHYICNFAYELATAFSLFYQFCPVLRAEPGVRDFRLTLVDKVRFALKELLSLLGIEVTEVM